MGKEKDFMTAIVKGIVAVALLALVAAAITIGFVIWGPATLDATTKVALIGVSSTIIGITSTALGILGGVLGVPKLAAAVTPSAPAQPASPQLPPEGAALINAAVNAAKTMQSNQ